MKKLILKSNLYSIIKKTPVLNIKSARLVQVAKYCYEARKVDVTGSKQMYMIDTHLLVKSLESSGLTSGQSETLTTALVQLSQGKMDFIHKNLVTKEQQEILLQQIMSHMSSIKKDMIILEKSEFSNLKHEYEKQSIEIQQMNRHFNDELLKLKAGVALDLNLEKSRAKDAHAESEKSVTQLQNKLQIFASSNEKDLAGLDNKIGKEIANLLATYERYRNDVIKYAGGTIMTCLGICLGFYRIWAK